MVAFTKNIVALTAAISFFGAAAAAPATGVDYVSLIQTAPGLPTVKDLGLTNKDLTKPVPELAAIIARDTLEKRYEPQCWGEPKCNINDALACFNYLYNLGDTWCEVSGIVQMCRMGACAWLARSENVGYTSSRCRDAAVGGGWVLGNCRSGDRLSGSNAAYANGNMIVDVVGR